MHPASTLPPRARAWLRVALSYYVTTGLSAALGLLLISAGFHFCAGPLAGSVAAVGVVVCIPPDLAAPLRRKVWQLLPAACFGLPLFVAVQALHEQPLALGLLLVPATFLAFLGGAWGKRGLPIVVSVMLAMIFSMAVPPAAGNASIWARGLYFALGAGLYLVWATAANAVLNARYRVLLLADTLLALVDLMRTQARQFVPDAGAATGQDSLIGELLRQQAALADQLQTARDLLLESPRSARRRRWAAMLIQVLEMRDHLLACALDLDSLKAHASHAPVLAVLRQTLLELADEVEALADAFLLGRAPGVAHDHRPLLQTLPWDASAGPDASAGSELSPAALTRSLAGRVGHINDETLRLVALARGDTDADLATVRTAWQMFVSSTTWSWQPLASLWRWDAPPLRHALRAALAITTGYVLALALPWGTHDYWILLTIVVVLRGSLAQTLERRNNRVAGTLLGCLIAAVLLWSGTPPWALLLVMTLAQAVAHGFAPRKYLVTAVAATVLGLLQAHLLRTGASPVFDATERMADTLIGAAIAWVFSYVLPSWERGLIPALVARTLTAQARHACAALGLGQLEAVDNEPELAWRLARREAYDSLSALVQATQRSLSEPRAVRPPLQALERLLAHSYQLLAQLTAVKTMLLLRRSQLDPAHIREPLRDAADTIASTLIATSVSTVEPGGGAPPAPEARPESPVEDLSPWALRRLAIATGLAAQLRQDADEVQQGLASPSR